MASPEIRLVVVQPKYQINLGYIARVAKNFGLNELYLIKPRCNWKGVQAIKYSKHARALLDGAKIGKNIKEVSNGFLVVGTTGLWKRGQGSFHNIYTLEDFLGLARKNSYRKICVLLGRDDTGLTSDEMRECDALVSIPADEKYPVLNISHALAIILYSLRMTTGEKSGGEIYASEKEVENLAGIFYKRLSKNPKVRDRNAVRDVFKRVLRRAKPSRREINALHAAFSDE